MSCTDFADDRFDAARGVRGVTGWGLCALALLASDLRVGGIVCGCVCQL